MKEYRVSPTLKDDLDFVLTRDGITHSFFRDDSGSWIVETDLTARPFHTAVIDAMCEAHRRETGSKYPFYSLETLKDREKFLRLQELFWTRKN